MTQELKQAIERLRRYGYKVEGAPYSAVSADGFMMSHLVDGRMAAACDIITMANGLDHLPSGSEFACGQAVQLLKPLAGIPVGTVVSVDEVSADGIKLRRENKTVRIQPDHPDLLRLAVRHFPPPLHTKQT
jgi:hypothetical protein